MSVWSCLKSEPKLRWWNKVGPFSWWQRYQIEWQKDPRRAGETTEHSLYATERMYIWQQIFVYDFLNWDESCCSARFFFFNFFFLLRNVFFEVFLSLCCNNRLLECLMCCESLVYFSAGQESPKQHRSSGLFIFPIFFFLLGSKSTCSYSPPS